MLQAIDDQRDPHSVRSIENGVVGVTASLHDGKKHLLLAASGSVATIKIPEIAKALSAGSTPDHLSIRVVLTGSARHFLAGQSREQPAVDALHDIPCVDGVYDDADEWGPEKWRRGAGILHIELRRWADLLCVAPLSANTLGKITNGLCDNLLSSVIRAWDTEGSIDGRRKTILVCPAMNTAMWRHPITKRQIRTLEEDWGVGAGGWVEVMRPMEKALACGDVGDGAMADWKAIVQTIQERLGL